MTFKLFTPSDESILMDDCISQWPDGAILTYGEIETTTNIKMNTRGKEILRRRLRKCHREYLTQRGVGIELSSPVNARGIIATRFQRIDGALKRGQSSHENLSHHTPAMDGADQAVFNYVGSLFGAMRATAAALKGEYRRMLAKPNAVTTPSHIEPPKA